MQKHPPDPAVYLESVNQKPTTMKTSRNIIVLLACLFVATAFRPGQINDNNNFDTQKFIKETASDGMKEVQLAQYVQQHVNDQDVKDYAKMLEQDHKKANDKLKELARQRQNNWNIPDQMMQEHQEQLNKMKSKTGDDLRDAYLDAMIDGHKKEIDKFKEAAEEVENEALRQWIEETIPVLQKHLDRAQELRNS